MTDVVFLLIDGTQSEYANHYMTDVVFLLIDTCVAQNQKILIL
jgi:hypothetical protein